MLTFFRKIRKSFIGSLPSRQAGGSVQKYLLYAIGEILLVMIGILLALQVNNWNGEREKRILEKETLIQLKAELQADLKMMNSNRDFVLSALISAERIAYHLKSKKVYPDSLMSDFNILSRGRSFDFNNTALKTLEARGLDLIEDQNLRNQIIELYSKWYPSITGIMDNFIANLDGFFRPLLRSHFIYPDVNSENQAIHPVDFRSLKSHLEFNNAVRVARSNYAAMLVRYDNAIAAAQDIISSIELQHDK